MRPPLAPPAQPASTPQMLESGVYESNPPFCEVPAALEEMRAGRMVVVVDDEDRENEGDLTMAAEKVTPEAINFMARFGRGLICLSLTEERCDYLRLAPMTNANESPFGTAFTESIEAREGVTTGISAADRARTIRSPSIPPRAPPTWCAPATSFPCAPAPAACWSAPGKPKPASIWRAWPDSTPPASSARS